MVTHHRRGYQCALPFGESSRGGRKSRLISIDSVMLIHVYHLIYILIYIRSRGYVYHPFPLRGKGDEYYIHLFSELNAVIYLLPIPTGHQESFVRL